MLSRTPALFGLLLAVASCPVAAADFDTTLMPLCLEVAEAPHNTEPAETLSKSAIFQTIQKGFGQKLKLDTSQIAQNKERLLQHQQILDDLRHRLDALTSDAEALLAPGSLPADLKINIVCGAPSDGFGLQIDGALQLFLNLPMIQPDFLEHLIRHELWHVAFRNLLPKHSEAFERSKNPLRQLAFIILNEGVGHYFSFRRRVEPDIQYLDWNDRTSQIFELMRSQVDTLQQTEGADTIQGLLDQSHAGVPFWKKWGAIPGAIATYRLRKTIGDKNLQKLIEDGPCNFMTTYNNQADQYKDWQKFPEELTQASCT